MQCSGFMVLGAALAVAFGVTCAEATPFTLLGEAEVLGGPAGGNFDSPFHVFGQTVHLAL
jgi:hypothetical protein